MYRISRKYFNFFTDICMQIIYETVRDKFLKNTKGVGSERAKIGPYF